MVLTAAGFEPARTVLHLDFAGTDLAGLDVRMYVPPLGVFKQMTAIAGLGAAMAAGQLTPEQAERTVGIYDALATYMKSWNVVSGGVPVPCTVEGLATQELGFLNRIFQAWLSTVGSVPDPLAPSSPSTSLPDLSLIPMQAIPASPTS